MYLLIARVLRYELVVSPAISLGLASSGCMHDYAKARGRLLFKHQGDDTQLPGHRQFAPRGGWHSKDIACYYTLVRHDTTTGAGRVGHYVAFSPAEKVPKPSLARPGRGSDDTCGPGRPTGPLRGCSVFHIDYFGCVYTCYARIPSSCRARKDLTCRRTSRGLCRRHEERYDISLICDLSRLYMIPVVLIHPTATAELTSDV